MEDGLLKEDIDIAKVNKVVDNIERWDELTPEEVYDLLSDADVQNTCKLLSAYRYVKTKDANAEPEIASSWRHFYYAEIASFKKRRLFGRVWMYASISAIALAIIVWGINLYHSSFQESGHLMAFIAEDSPQEVLLGKNGGQMEDIIHANNDHGVVIGKGIADFSHAGIAASGVRLLSTPRGKAYKLILSDGTEVILNAESKLEFPIRFTGNNRKVYLTGEAYFKVSKDSKHPFIVETEKLSTTVLGTEFNLKAYPESDSHVTLISGSVSVRSFKNKEVVLKPGEDVALGSGNVFNITCVDTEYYMQWKEGFFYFDNLPLIDILKEIGRWYNVDIEICDNSLISYRLHFVADRNASIEQVVNNLNAFNYIDAELKGNKITLCKKKQEK